MDYTDLKFLAAFLPKKKQNKEEKKRQEKKKKKGKEILACIY